MRTRHFHAPPIGAQLSLFQVRENRDRALEQVLEHSRPWKERALSYLDAAIPQLPDEVFTWEAVRRLVEEHVGLPHHANCWGALTKEVRKRGWIKFVTGTQTSKAEAANGRALQKYVKGRQS